MAEDRGGALGLGQAGVLDYAGSVLACLTQRNRLLSREGERIEWASKW